MKKIFLILNSSFLIFNSLSAQPAIQWQKCLGGTAQEAAYFIEQTSDQGFIVAGMTYSTDGDVTGNHGDTDYWMVKLDNIGNLQWQKCLGGSGGDMTRSLAQITDNGYIVAGYTYSTDGDVIGNHGNSDYWIVRLNNTGNLLWQKCLGGSNSEMGTAIKQTSDGGFVVAGWTDSNNGDVTGNHGGKDYWVVKTDIAGNLQWQKCFGGTNDEWAYSVQQTTDAGFIVAGYSYSTNGDVTGNHGNRDYWVVKMDNAGTLQWQKCLGGLFDDVAYYIEQTTDGGFIAGGYTESFNGDVTGNHGDADCWLVKLDNLGNLQWQKCLGGTNTDYAHMVQQTTDGGFMVSGYSKSNNGDVSGNHGDADYWLAKLDGSGNLQWQKCLGGTWQDIAYSFAQTSDGGSVVAGYAVSNNGDVSGNHGIQDYWIVKLSAFVNIEEDANISSFNIFPNPVSREFVVRSSEFREIEMIEIYSSLGEKVFSQIANLKSQISIDVSKLPPGIYSIIVTDQTGNKVTKKVVKM